MKERIKKNKFNIIIFIIYGLLSLGLIFAHETWRDEAQQWILVRDLNFFDLIKQLSYEGHFLLWYLILFPFAKLGLPFFFVNIISWFFVSIAVIIILFKAPFSKINKVLIIFSFPMLYLYPVISRCYCLIPISIILISIFYKERMKRPFRYILSIVLLANTHIIMLGMVGVLSLDFFIEFIKNKKNLSEENKKRILNSIILEIVLLIFSGLPLIKSLYVNKFVGNSKSIWYNILNAIFVQPIVIMVLLFNKYNSNITIIPTLVLTLYAIYYSFIYYRKELFKFFIILEWQFLINSFIYNSTDQRTNVIILISLFFLWTKDRDKKKNDIAKKIYKICLKLLLIINILNGLIFCVKELNYKYSSAKETAEYMNNNFDKDSIILVGNQPEYYISMMVYTDLKFYSIQRGEYYTYAVYDDISKKNLDKDFIDEIENKFKDNENLYYIYSKEKFDKKRSDKKIVNNLEKKGILTKVYESSKNVISDEKYIIYKLN